MFCAGDLIFLKMFASFMNSKLSKTEYFDEGLACVHNAISHTDKAGRINQWYDHLLSSSSQGNEGNILLCTATSTMISNRQSTPDYCYCFCWTYAHTENMCIAWVRWGGVWAAVTDVTCDMCRGDPKELLPVVQQEVTRAIGNEVLRNMSEKKEMSPLPRQYK